jgi:tetratricopeptide (TPR) repeat protein
MLKDAQGLEVTTDSREAIAAINHFIEQALSYGKDAEAVICQGIAADPKCAIIHAYAAAYYLSQENAVASQRAILHLKDALANSLNVTERESLYIQAISAWRVGEISLAIALHEAITDMFKSDLISVQQGQYHYFYLGDKERLLKIAEKVLPANRENHFLIGMVAFGLEQCHRFKQAEAMGRMATAMNRHDPWAHHAVAHVMETQGRVDEGIAWMSSLADTWESCNSMLYTHNWWHIALYYLELGDSKKALELYDTRIWGRANQQSPKDQVGAISLLSRLELRGIDVGDRWQELSIYLFPRLHEHALPFQDLHYIYALARARYTDWVNEMRLSMHKHSLTVNPDLRASWLEVAIPFSRGLFAYAKGEYLNAIAQLKPVLPRLHLIGGSHAQRALFEQFYQDAVLQAEQQSRVYSMTHC